jgi:hypothetical protein
MILVADGSGFARIGKRGIGPPLNRELAVICFATAETAGS